MYLRRLFKDMEWKYDSFMNACDLVKDELNERFFENEAEEVIDEVFYQPSDGFVMAWGDGNNTPLDIEIIDNINSKKEMMKYLEENTI